jgi:hypothetical protein
VISAPQKQVAADAPRNIEPGDPDWQIAYAAPTGYAGVLFLLNVLDRLGISDFLAQTPTFTDARFAQRLVRDFCRAVNAPPDDAIYTVVSPEALEPTITELYCAPSRWKAGLCNMRPWQVKRIGASNILFDGSGRLPLAFWQGALPESVQALIGDQIVRDTSSGVGISSANDLDNLIRQSWLLAVRRWCWKFAHLTLRSIVRRPGRITVTPTHVDAFFSAQQTDLRIRRLGLDFDPGWVPWLERVVHFHYETGVMQ